jgi:wobble nucleotide-excising tRNase
MAASLASHQQQKMSGYKDSVAKAKEVPEQFMKDIIKESQAFRSAHDPARNEQGRQLQRVLSSSALHVAKSSYTEKIIEVVAAAVEPGKHAKQVGSR